jgi:hypothetical protein
MGRKGEIMKNLEGENRMVVDGIWPEERPEYRESPDNICPECSCEEKNLRHPDEHLIDCFDHYHVDDVITEARRIQGENEGLRFARRCLEKEIEHLKFLLDGVGGITPELEELAENTARCKKSATVWNELARKYGWPIVSMVDKKREA